MNHVDVDQLLEDYAWSHFKDIQSLRRTRLDEFKSLERDDCEFIINRRNLSWVNEDPQYTDLTPVGAKPYTLFKSIYTNNTNRPQEYSFKTERTTESLCSISRDQGYTMGAEAELTLKTPYQRGIGIWKFLGLYTLIMVMDGLFILAAIIVQKYVRIRARVNQQAVHPHGLAVGGEIAELKAGFKHEMHFSNLQENCQTEILSWGVDSNVAVPPHYCTEASIIIEEMNYRGSYSVVTKLSGSVVISIRRRRDGALVLPIRVNIAEVFLAHLESPHCKKEVKQVVTIEQRKIVRLLSKGSCHFQFAMKQRIDLKEDPIGVGREIMID